MRHTKCTGLFLTLACIAACASRSADLPPPTVDEPAYTVYIVQRDWHTGIAVRLADIPSGLWPEQADFRDATYLEAGWGDWDYYQAERPGLGTLTAAGLWPTRSVLNVERIPGSVPERYRCSHIIELRLATTRFQRLVRFIHDSFERGGAPRVAPLQSGVPGQSNYYPARGRFHLFNTCNAWVLRALQAAGYPVHTTFSMTAASLRARTKPFGRLIEPRASCR